MKEYEVFETIFGTVAKTAPTKDEKKTYTKEEVEKLLALEKEKWCADPRTIKLGSVIAARRMLEGLGFTEATVSDYYKTETGEIAHIDCSLKSTRLVILNNRVLFLDSFICFVYI